AVQHGSKAGSLPGARRRPPDLMTRMKRPSACMMVGATRHGRHGFGMDDAQGPKNGQKLAFLLQLGRGTSSPSQIQQGTSKA
ncbi:hypothetical protein HAX54_010870, partial [Datura stramonium]|nr:hypothetical protein [Datura stramonium]